MSEEGKTRSTWAFWAFFLIFYAPSLLFTEMKQDGSIFMGTFLVVVILTGLLMGIEDRLPADAPTRQQMHKRQFELAARSFLWMILILTSQILSFKGQPEALKNWGALLTLILLGAPMIWVVKLRRQKQLSLSSGTDPLIIEAETLLARYREIYTELEQRGDRSYRERLPLPPPPTHERTFVRVEGTTQQEPSPTLGQSLRKTLETYLQARRLGALERMQANRNRSDT